jgi:hypothetical protein
MKSGAPEYSGIIFPRHNLNFFKLDPDKKLILIKKTGNVSDTVSGSCLLSPSARQNYQAIKIPYKEKYLCV